VQLQRLKARPGMDRRRLENTLARQMSDAEKRRRADYIIPTGRSRGETMRTITRIVKDLRARTTAPCRRRRGANNAKPLPASAPPQPSRASGAKRARHPRKTYQV
jgi:hypothetical protein